MNALHLENYGVSALETREMREVEGGIWPLIAGIAIGIAVSEYYHHHK